jgi:hypothetical protein
MTDKPTPKTVPVRISVDQIARIDACKGEHISRDAFVRRLIDWALNDVEHTFRAAEPHHPDREHER